MARKAETKDEPEAGASPVLIAQLIVLAAATAVAAMVIGLDPLFAAYETGG